MTETPTSIRGPVGKLEALLHESPAPSRVSIAAHPHPLYGGTMNNVVVERCCRLLASLGHTVLRFNFRGVGQSEGVHDEGRGEVLDLLAACEALREITGRDVDLGVGYSFGAATMLRALGTEQEADHDKPPHAAILVAPPLALGDYDFVANIRPIRPLALLCGSQDELTPADKLETAQRWPGLVGTELIDGVGHDLGACADPETFDRAAERLVQATLSQLSSPTDAVDSTGTGAADSAGGSNGT